MMLKWKSCVVALSRSLNDMTDNLDRDLRVFVVNVQVK